MVFFLFSRLDNDASERIVLFRILNKTRRRPLSGWNWISEWEEEKPTIFSYHCIYDEREDAMRNQNCCVFIKVAS
jgi:hypothetical protein